jgi:hypothetical protein
MKLQDLGMRTYFIFLFFIVSNILYCSEQEPDILFINGLKYDLETQAESPLEIYFYSAFGKNPFSSLSISTGNYRGFIATWELNDNKLYLKSVMVDDYNNLGLAQYFDLNKIILEEDQNTLYSADWFSGFIFARKPKTNHVSLIKFQNGEVTEIAKFGYKYESSNFKLLDQEFDKFRDSFFKEKSNQKNESKYKKIHHYINKTVSKFRAKLKEINEQEKYAIQESNIKVYKNLSGYNEMAKIFKVNSSTLGEVNLVPYSLFVTLTTRKDDLIDDIWWWSPLKDNTPLHTWNDMLSHYTKVEDKLNRLPWILEWKKSDPQNSIEVHIIGDDIGENRLELSLIDQIYKHAKIQPSPNYSILLRSNLNWTASLYLSNIDDNTIIKSVSDTKTNCKHWMFKNPIFYHQSQEIPEYMIVDKLGQWRINKRKK